MKQLRVGEGEWPCSVNHGGDAEMELECGICGSLVKLTPGKHGRVMQEEHYPRAVCSEACLIAFLLERA